jgi:hypothetical protein
MAALTGDAAYCSSVGDTTEVGFSANAADTYYKGALVFIDTGGGVQVVPAAGDMCIGISPSQQVIAAASDEVQVLVRGLVWLPVGSGIAAADEGDMLIMDISATQSDNPADCISAGDATGLAANDIAIGRILRATSTKMLIHIGDGTGEIYNATIGNFAADGVT